MSDRYTRTTLQSLTARELRALAVGMPYRSEARKDQLVDWLLQYVYPPKG